VRVLSRREILAELESLSDSKYQKFTSSLLPGTASIMGVRIPDLRAMARRLADNNWKSALKDLSDDTFEEKLLQGLIIGYAKANADEILSELEIFVPKIDNWSVCDSTVTTLKIAKKYPGTFFSFAKECIDDGREFFIRFGVDMMIFHFIDENHISSVLSILNEIQSDDYYAKMAVAWAVSLCYVKFPNITDKWLLETSLDDWTFNKSIQKIKESYRVSKEDKKRLSLLLRY